LRMAKRTITKGEKNPPASPGSKRTGKGETRKKIMT